jgi:P4 family phage/plasmid primase-like protien
LQLIFGYGLSGSIIEHALFFLYGTGANGKSVLLSTISGIMGGYHCTAPIETFTTSSNDRHPTELAGLRAARLVTAIETEEGRRWAESRIKALTGGDRIAARFMHQDFFEYAPQFKLVIAGNHKPALRNVDEAMRRRFNLIPFAVTIPPEERDDKLTDRLQQEWPGILQWMIDGCMRWQRDKLSPPKVVADATLAYLEAEDAIAAWLDECATEIPMLGKPPATFSYRGRIGQPKQANRSAASDSSVRRSRPGALSPPANTAKAVAVSLVRASDQSTNPSTEPCRRHFAPLPTISIRHARANGVRNRANLAESGGLRIAIR